MVENLRATKSRAGLLDDLFDSQRKLAFMARQFSQTRSLPCGRYTTKDLVDWLTKMGQERDGPIPDWFEPMFDKVLDELPARFVDNALRSSSISVESSHCFERVEHPDDSDLNNTKAAFVRSLITENSPTPKISIQTLEETGSSLQLTEDYSNLGEYVWSRCLSTLRREMNNASSDVWKCNIAAIREPGAKTRIVTSSSYWHAGFL